MSGIKLIPMSGKISRLIPGKMSRTMSWIMSRTMSRIMSGILSSMISKTTKNKMLEFNTQSHIKDNFLNNFSKSVETEIWYKVLVNVRTDVRKNVPLDVLTDVGKDVRDNVLILIWFFFREKVLQDLQNHTKQI